MKIRNKNLIFLVPPSWIDYLIDAALIFIFSALAFQLTYHPYFFGDELFANQLAISSDYSFSAIFQGMNAYKPRLLFNAIEALLAKSQASRLTHCVIVIVCMAWINMVLYYFVRFLFDGSRLLALLVVAVVLTSRYGMMLYFDYVSGMIELLSTALLLSVILLVCLGWRGEFNRWYALITGFVAILCIFSHERYVAALFAVGMSIVFAEWKGAFPRRRISVLFFGLALPCVPLALFLIANATFGSAPIVTGTAGQQVNVGGDTLWSALTYVYNVFLGGNYGHEWFWGHYNYLHPVGRILGLSTVAFTLILTISASLKNEIAWNNSRIGAGFMAVIIALIAIASLAGSTRQEARFMVPVGIFVAMFWVVMLKNVWRHIAIALILMTNVTYLMLDSYDSIANVYSSRAASSMASSLLGVEQSGRNAIIVGNSDDAWTFGGSSLSDLKLRQGAAFSRVNFRSEIQIDPFVGGRTLDAKIYDYGLAFDGFGPHRIARYRLVSVDTALILAGVESVDKLPINSVLGSGDSWLHWQWSAPPDYVEGAVKLVPGMKGLLAWPVSKLDGRWLVYRARNKEGTNVPMRLQVNWHAKQDNRFLSTMIQVVYPDKEWRSYAALLKAPLNSEIGYVYANLQDGNQGEIELKVIDLR
jgi:hypothetical protein